MIPRAGLSLGEILLREHIHELVVLGVYFDESTDFLCFLKHLEEYSVGNAEIIYHKHLERRNADLDAFADAVDQTVLNILYCDMERVIDRSDGCAESITPLYRIGHLLAEIL